MMKLGAGSRQVVQSSPLIQVLEVSLLKVRAGVEREPENVLMDSFQQQDITGECLNCAEA